MPASYHQAPDSGYTYECSRQDGQGQGQVRVVLEAHFGDAPAPGLTQWCLLSSGRGAHSKSTLDEAAFTLYRSQRVAANIWTGIFLQWRLMTFPLQ